MLKPFILPPLFWNQIQRWHMAWSSACILVSFFGICLWYWCLSRVQGIHDHLFPLERTLVMKLLCHLWWQPLSSQGRKEPHQLLFLRALWDWAYLGPHAGKWIISARYCLLEYSSSKATPATTHAVNHSWKTTEYHDMKICSFFLISV